jgi:hypothetical protein
MQTLRARCRPAILRWAGIDGDTVAAEECDHA